MLLTGLVLVTFSKILPKVFANPIANRGGNLVNFIYWGTQSREICWRPDPGFPEIGNTFVPCCQQWATQKVPAPWSGVFWPMTNGTCNPPTGADEGVIAEVTWQGFVGNTYYDVSAIDSTNDDGIHWIFPTSHFLTPDGFWSGCFTFPCATAYQHWNDVQTLSTPETSINVLMGTGIHDVDHDLS